MEFDHIFDFPPLFEKISKILSVHIYCIKTKQLRGGKFKWSYPVKNIGRIPHFILFSYKKFPLKNSVINEILMINNSEFSEFHFGKPNSR